FLGARRDLDRTQSRKLGRNHAVIRARKFHFDLEHAGIISRAAQIGVYPRASGEREVRARQRLAAKRPCVSPIRSNRAACGWTARSLCEWLRTCRRAPYRRSSRRPAARLTG